MKKKIYYVIKKELQDIDGIEETTGRKEIVVYEVVDNTPKEFFTLDVAIDDNSEEEIDSYLIDNGYGDEIFEMVEL